jgi:hypothetical protein
VSPEELNTPGAVKLMLEILDMTEEDRNEYKGYLPRYYEAEKRASVLAERLQTDVTNEILSSLCIALGGTIIGLAPFLWDEKHSMGLIALAVGIVLMLGGALTRFIYKRKK